VASRTAAELVGARIETDEELHLPVRRSWGALLLASAEALCVFVVSSAKLGLVMAATSAGATSWVALWHRNALRVPALVVASLGAIANLLVVRRALVLRSAPSAAWRRRPFTQRERWRIAAVVVLSAASLFVAASEVLIHDILHHLGH
jgi:hypothetical protein